MQNCSSANSATPCLAKPLQKAPKISLNLKNRQSSQIPFLQNLVIGGFSASIAETFGAPMTRVRMILQTQQANPAIRQKFKGPLDCLLRIVKENGTLALWRGNGVNLCNNLPTLALSLAFKEEFRSFFVPETTEEGNFKRVLLGNLMSGAATTVTVLSFLYPLELAYTRMATDTSHQKRSLRGMLGKIWKEGGVRGLYQGFLPSTVTVSLFRAGYFGLYDTFSPSFGPTFVAKYLLSQLVNVASNGLTYPMDTVRRAIMVQEDGYKENLSKKAFSLVRKIWQEEGIPGFYRGFFTNCCRGLASGLILVINDKLRVLANSSQNGEMEVGELI